MNLKMVFRVIGRILSVEAVLLLLPLAVSLIYRETAGAAAFAITAILSLAVGLLLTVVFRTKNQTIYAKEGFAIVALVWICMSAIGALPFVISREIPSYVDAFFETVSGFTTTGASILDNVEAMSHGMLFWRSFTHWVGGMGVLVFVMAIIPNISDRSIHIMRAEVPGPVKGKLVPKLKDTAKILYCIYIGITLTEVVLLLFGGMNLYESLVYAFGTAGTGGFGIKADSVGSYSPYIQWVIAIFMLLFGVNFNLYYLILIKKLKSAFSSTEMWTYFGIVAVASALIFTNTRHMFSGLEEALRQSVFQVASILTTTGFATTDFNLWPTFSKTVILILMFCGGCAGSTAGGLKVSRVLLLFKIMGRELKRMLHPRSVKTIKLEGKAVDESTLSACCTYFSLYMACLIGIFLLLGFDSFGNIETNFSAAAACFNNIGPGLDKIGPVFSYSGFSDLSTVILSFAMLLGRLEIIPLMLLFSASTWKKN